mmetsp:Transcript_17081/g.56597  ORF Transcript_17081/g.56597 Transcript_17081/m.56597 type:complete len:392 (-) Transcript_17081:129-1304(-)
MQRGRGPALRRIDHRAGPTPCRQSRAISREPASAAGRRRLPRDPYLPSPAPLRALVALKPRKGEHDDGDVVAVVALLDLPHVGRLVDNAPADLGRVEVRHLRDQVRNLLRLDQLPDAVRRDHHANVRVGNLVLGDLGLGDDADGGGGVVADGAGHRQPAQVVPHARGRPVRAGGSDMPAAGQYPLHLCGRVWLLVEGDVDRDEAVRLWRLPADDRARVARVGQPDVVPAHDAAHGRRPGDGRVAVLRERAVNLAEGGAQRLPRVGGERGVRGEHARQGVDHVLRHHLPHPPVPVKDASHEARVVARKQPHRNRAVLVDLLHGAARHRLEPRDRVRAARRRRRHRRARVRRLSGGRAVYAQPASPLRRLGCLRHGEAAIAEGLGLPVRVGGH